jgi:hypothetical protein
MVRRDSAAVVSAEGRSVDAGYANRLESFSTRCDESAKLMSMAVRQLRTVLYGRMIRRGQFANNGASHRVCSKRHCSGSDAAEEATATNIEYVAGELLGQAS